jgi:hypothetical protein
MIEDILRTVVYIEVAYEEPRDDWVARGTGFLVWRSAENGQGRCFVVTNRHVIWDPKYKEGNGPVVALRVHCVAKKEDGSLGRAGFERELTNGDGTLAWRTHSDELVDVAVVDVSEFLRDPTFEGKAFAYDHFAGIGDLSGPFEIFEIVIATPVLVLGYPTIGIKHRDYSYPLVRQGIIASWPGEDLVDENGNELPAFYVDGAIIPGSSGSPVMFVPSLPGDAGNILYWHKPRVHPAPVLNTIIPVVMVGVIAEATLSNVRTSGFEGFGYAGLGLAFKAEAIRETVERFFE